jgi:hypothetical protein
LIKRWQYWLLTILAAAAIGLAVINGTVFVSNRNLQVAVNNRQQFVLQSMQLEALYREMVKALADLSARSNDDQLRNLLKAHGITYTVNPPAAPPTPPRAQKNR